MNETLRGVLDQAWEADRRLSFFGFSGLERSLSFSEFGSEVSRIAQTMRGLGVKPGVVVAVMGATGVELTKAVAACWTVGATLTVLPTPTRLGNLEQFVLESLEKLRRSQAALLLGEEDSVSIFRELSGLPVCSFSELGGEGIEVAELSPVAFGSEPPALIQFSSGTTRDPQPILLSQGALLHNSRAVLSRFPGGADRHSCVSWLPLYHDMGLIGCFLMPLLAPGDLTLMGPEVFVVRPAAWLEAISQQRATTSSAPNFAFALCADRLSDEEIAGLDLSCWEIAMVGAETVRPQTLEKFARRFASAGFDARAFSPVYGLAEATLAVTFSPLGEGLHTLGHDPDELASTGRVVPGARAIASLGQPLDGVELEIRSNGTALGEDRLGEVWVKSPSLMIGYHDSDTRPVQDGWLSTGDSGFVHQGDLYLYGRRRDILLLDGRNHDPGTVEEVAEELPEIRRACAFTQETEAEKDLLVLLCEIASSVVGDELEPLREKLRSQCRRRTNLLVDRVLLVKSGALPVTSSGKLRRAVAAQMYYQGDLVEVQLATVGGSGGAA